MLNKQEILDLVNEFEDRRTNEAIFAYYCDKLECDLQCKLYDEESTVDLNKQSNNPIINNPLVQQLLKQENTWSQMWLKFGQATYNYEKSFLEISNYALNNNITIKDTESN